MSETACLETESQTAKPAALPLSTWCLLGGGAVLLAAAAGVWTSVDPATFNFDPLRLDHLLVLAAVLPGFAFLFRKPEPGLLLLMALLYGNASEVAVRYHGLPSVLQGVGIVLGLVVIGRRLSVPGERLQGDISLLLVAAYCFVLFATSVHAVNPALADKKLIEHTKGLLTFALVINLVRSRVALDRAVWTLLVVGAALSTISSFQVFTSSYAWDFGGFGRIKDAQIVGDLRQPRISGPFADPNFYAQILIPLVPLGLYRLRIERSSRRRLAAAYAPAACLAALVFTYSRGAILALAVMLGLVLVIERVRLKHCLAGLAVLALALSLVPQQFEQRLATLGQFADGNEPAAASTDSSFRQRSLLMRAAWEMWRKNPLAGVGAGNYPEHYQEYADRIGSSVSSYEEFGEQRFAHSLYLEMAAETGLAGLTVFLAIILTVGVKGWRAIRIFSRLGDLKSARLLTALLVGLAGYMTTGLFLHASYPRHLWLLLALVAASARIAREAGLCRKTEGAA